MDHFEYMIIYWIGVSSYTLSRLQHTIGKLIEFNFRTNNQFAWTYYYTFMACNWQSFHFCMERHLSKLTPLDFMQQTMHAYSSEIYIFKRVHSHYVSFEITLFTQVLLILQNVRYNKTNDWQWPTITECITLCALWWYKRIIIISN